MTHVSLNNVKLDTFFFISLHAVPWNNDPSSKLRLCWINDISRKVRTTDATELLTDIDTRVELLAHPKTLTVILQYTDSNDAGSEL